MTKALQEAFAAVSALPDVEQDALAAAILDEVTFDAAIASHPEALDRLADEAIEDHRGGLSKALDPDEI